MGSEGGPHQGSKLSLGVSQLQKIEEKVPRWKEKDGQKAKHHKEPVGWEPGRVQRVWVPEPGQF